jgi:hypothetical protein
MIDVHNSIISDLALDKFTTGPVWFLETRISYLDNNEDTKERETIKKLLDIFIAYKKANKKDYKIKYDETTAQLNHTSFF